MWYKFKNLKNKNPTRIMIWIICILQAEFVSLQPVLFAELFQVGWGTLLVAVFSLPKLVQSDFSLGSGWTVKDIPRLALRLVLHCHGCVSGHWCNENWSFALFWGPECSWVQYVDSFIFCSILMLPPSCFTITLEIETARWLVFFF